MPRGTSAGERPLVAAQPPGAHPNGDPGSTFGDRPG